MFANFIALVMHYRIYNMLKKMDLPSRYSPEDVIMHLGCPNSSDVAAKYIRVSGDESLTALQTLSVPPILASYVESAFRKLYITKLCAARWYNSSGFSF